MRSNLRPTLRESSKDKVVLYVVGRMFSVMDRCIVIVAVAFLLQMSEAFILASSRFHRHTTVASTGDDGNNNVFAGVKDFFRELDNFLDDATSRRLGNGAAFYGKRKSNFYGKDDKNRKADPGKADPLEDFQAPLNGGYFQWMPDENGDMRPVTRMKKKIVERNPSFWDKVFEAEGE